MTKMTTRGLWSPVAMMTMRRTALLLSQLLDDKKPTERLLVLLGLPRTFVSSPCGGVATASARGSSVTKTFGERQIG